MAVLNGQNIPTTKESTRMRLKLLLFAAILLTTCAASVSAQAVQSIYTDTSAGKCKTVKAEEQGAYAKLECPGVAGYKLILEDFDLRQTITVVAPNGSQHQLNLGNTGGFSYVGKKAEWRVRNEGGKMVPFALILRFNINETMGSSNKYTSYLTVSKITPDKICITDNRIPPTAGANVAARRAADSAATKPCIE
jgi:hypothetical protein